MKRMKCGSMKRESLPMKRWRRRAVEGRGREKKET